MLPMNEESRLDFEQKHEEDLTDIFCIQSHDFFKICDITSTAYLPHTGNSWFDGDSGSVMQFIF